MRRPLSSSSARSSPGGENNSCKIGMMLATSLLVALVYYVWFHHYNSPYQYIKTNHSNHHNVHIHKASSGNTHHHMTDISQHHSSDSSSSDSTQSHVVADLQLSLPSIDISSASNKYDSATIDLSIFKNEQFVSPLHMYVYKNNPDTKMNDIVSKTILEQGYWEKELTLAIHNNNPKAKLGPCDLCNPLSTSYDENRDCDCGVVVDIGGNIGYHTLVLAALGYYVITFEPFVDNLKIIQASVYDLNPTLADRITVIPYALSNVRTPMNCLLVSDANYGDTVTKCPPQLYGSHMTPRQWIYVNNLDDIMHYLFSNNLINGIETRHMHFHEWVIDIMKIDIEGYEPFAISGGNDIFNHNLVKQMYAECDNNLLRVSGWNASFWSDFAAEHEFIPLPGYDDIVGIDTCPPSMELGLQSLV